MANVILHNLSNDGFIGFAISNGLEETTLNRTPLFKVIDDMCDLTSSKPKVVFEMNVGGHITRHEVTWKQLRVNR